MPKDRRYDYTPPTYEELADRAERKGSNFDNMLKDVKIYKARQGANILRLLPPGWPKAAHHGLTIWVHGNIGPNNRRYLCLEQNATSPHKRCPVCDELRRMGSRATQEDKKELQAYQQIMYYAIDREDEKEGLQVWVTSGQNDAELAAQSVNHRNQSRLDIVNPDDGYDIEFTRSGTTFKNTRYRGFRVSRESSPLSDSDRRYDEWLDAAFDVPLPDTLIYYTPEHIEQVLFGKAASDDGERTERKRRDPDDDGEPLRRRRSREDEDEPRSRSRSRDEEDEPRSTRRRAEPEDEPRARSRSRDEDEPRSRRREEPEEPAPRSRRREPDPEDEPTPRPRRREPEPEDEPAPRSRRREEPEDEPAPRSRRREPEPEAEAEEPRRRRREPEPEAEEPPRRRQRSKLSEDLDDNIPSDAGRRGKANDADPDEDRPRRSRNRDEGREADEGETRTRTRREPEPEAEEAPRSRRREPEPEDAEEAPRSRRRAEPEAEADAEDEGRRERVRDRLRRRD